MTGRLAAIGRWRPRLLVVCWGLVTTGCGGILFPGPTSVASGSTPVPLRVQHEVAGAPRLVRDRVARILADSGFQLNDVRGGVVDAYSLTRLTKVYLQILPVRDTRDSSLLVVSGEVYLGDASHRDTISALPESWRLITGSDAAANLLHTMQRAAILSLGNDSYTPAAPFTVHRPDSSELAQMAQTPVGRTIDFCAPVSVPAGWLALYWFTDRTRCADSAASGVPNVVRVERQY